jgi:hypothetical protein
MNLHPSTFAHTTNSCAVKHTSMPPTHLCRSLPAPPCVLRPASAARLLVPAGRGSGPHTKPHRHTAPCCLASQPGSSGHHPCHQLHIGTYTTLPTTHTHSSTACDCEWQYGKEVGVTDTTKGAATTASGQMRERQHAGASAHSVPAGALVLAAKRTQPIDATAGGPNSPPPLQPHMLLTCQ